MIEDKNIKICKDCKYYESFWMDSNLAKCSNPNSKGYRIDPVTGDIYHQFCEIERYSFISNNCGPEARLFEPKEVKSIWPKFF